MPLLIEENYLKVKCSKKLNDYTNEELVKLAQKDIDEYRYSCEWECQECGYVLSYKNSLSLKEQPYIHELKCPNSFLREEKICGHKMILTRENGVSLNSIYFNELFARFQSKLMSESKKVRAENFEEVYSSLCSNFMKIVAMFARGEFTQTSIRWFSSFVQTSISNKIVDIHKMLNYNKRSPTVKCALCGKEVGQITAKHLSKEGHSKLFDKIFIDRGKHALSDSGEDFYYDKNSEDYFKRCYFLGENYCLQLTKKEKKVFYNEECLKTYNMMFPNSYFKNKIISTNENINSDSDSDFESEGLCNDSVFGDYSDDIVDRINIDNIVETFMDLVFENDIYLSGLDNYFEDIPKGEKIKIIREILYEKISYKIRSSELDQNYADKGVREGLTVAIFRMLKNSKKCRDFVLSEVN